ncbi:hypothetical protein ACJMK2_016609 [Sinanodonta woodiana]|uniref:C-type lectin domain-containing protein n=1 Tax=Sinanodonta woodiana TaxID=1069815 RepID=A0ABD3UXR7_SINWO
MKPVIFLATAVIVPMAYAACGSGWIAHGNSCYKFTTDIQNWVDARTMCKWHSADLAMVETRDENEWIKSQARKANHTDQDQGFWLGATDFIGEGHWYWESTQPLQFTYTDWGQLQPNNRNNSEHCLAILKYFDYAWSDEKCDWDNLNYICEKSIFEVIISVN